MAPPTRHSTRLGVTSNAVPKKEDENAGVNVSKLGVPTRTLRGRTASIAQGTKTQLANGKTATTALATNGRKRILDDRTNNVKSISTTAIVPTKPATKATAAVVTRKASTLTRKAGAAEPMVLEDVAINQPVTKTSARQIKPLKRNATAPAPEPRRPTTTSTTVVKKKVALTARPASKNVASTAPARQSSRRASANRSGVVKIEGEGRLSKKPRTSEPEEIEKENIRTEDADDEIMMESSKGKEVEKVKLKDGEQGWEDLDEGDEEDPLMVKEYVNEIYHYMCELELETLPDADYMSRQSELTWKMRGVLVDWIIEVHSKFRLLPETLYLAINLMDRFLTKRTVALIKFQLVGVTSLFLASKYEEVICPSVTNFLYMTDGGYENEEILKAETYMLEMLSWDLRYPNPLNFLRRVSKADHYDIQSRTFAKYFMEISIVDYRLVATAPSLLAATSIWLSRKLLNRGEWDANLIHYSGYTQDEILPTAQIMVDYILRTGCKVLGIGLEPNFVGAVGYEGGNEHGNLFKKYSTRKFFRVSELVRDWAVETYTYETPTGFEWDRLEEWAHVKDTGDDVNLTRKGGKKTNGKMIKKEMDEDDADDHEVEEDQNEEEEDEE